MSCVLQGEGVPTRCTQPTSSTQVDVLLVNDTEIPLFLDQDQDCQRECHHKGWQVPSIPTSPGSCREAGGGAGATAAPPALLKLLFLRLREGGHGGGT